MVRFTQQTTILKITINGFCNPSQVVGLGFRPTYHMRNHGFLRRGTGGHPGDIFSLGCLVHSLLSGKPPRR